MLEAAIGDLTRNLGPRFDPVHLVEIGWFILDDDDEAFISSWESDGRVDQPYELTPSEVIEIVVGC
ncbi:MAG: hypothetical protein ACKV2T_41020 [Kofleriaceae bacterium]